MFPNVLKITQPEAVQTIQQSADNAAINLLCNELNHLKQTEKNLKQKIDSVSSQIISMVGHETEGATRVESDVFKITTTGKLNRTIDQSSLQAVQDAIPAPLFLKAIKFKPSIDLKGLRYLENNELETYKMLSNAIITKSGKTSLTVEVIE